MVRILKKHYKPRPGAIELLSRFDTEVSSGKVIPRIAVYSDYPFLKERLDVLGFNPGKSILLYGPESFGAQKPATRPFTSIAKDLGAEPEEVLVIGDRDDTDGVGAFNAGMRFFCLETGRRRYYRLDPYRQHALRVTDQQGPSLLMYAGNWDNLFKLLMDKFFK